MDTIRASFSKIRSFFGLSKKGRGDLPHPVPQVASLPLVAPEARRNAFIAVTNMLL